MNHSSTENFPASPGVYIMKNNIGIILYVGKAKNLKNRIRSYFARSGDSRYQIRFLMARVSDIEYIVTDTEKEALILENTLIKKHRPRYNINLRDDKTYFSLRMDMAEEYPRLSVIRKVERDGASYFGPYSSAAAARDALKQIYKLFRLRHYPMESCRRRGRPCLFYQINQCSAPCFGLISKKDYAALAEGAILFLEGKNRDLIKALRKRMAEAAALENYEEAARFRDLIRSVEITVEKQKMVAHGGDMDVLGYYREGSLLVLSLLFIRGGCVIGSRNFSLTWEMDDEEGISSFLGEYYSRDVQIPDEILVPLGIEETGVFTELLSENKGKKVAVTFPRRGTKLELVRLADRNAETAAVEGRSEKERIEATLDDLKKRLHLAGTPRRIECFDISNIQGQLAVASKIAFLDAKPDKDNYRRYRINTVTGADDYGMMHEVLTRRFRKDSNAGDLPDLIIVDGGQGQLNVLTYVLRELGVMDIDAIALAKSRVEKGMDSPEISKSDERVFLPGRKNPVVMRQNSAPLLLLARIRDEAHRFAITHHKKLRGKTALHSSINEIRGVGEKRRKEMLRHFGSLKKIRNATLEEITEVQGMDRKTAQAVWEYFHGTDGDREDHITPKVPE
jgi:excinuclease ABC subunit C